jgi:thiazole/oxazole-forming peptide maturase SagD family component
MDVIVESTDQALAATTRRLLGRMLCPMSGIAQSIGFVMRGTHDPRITIAGGEMTGVHVLHDAPPPPPGAYHIGGSGLAYDEVMIRTLGETAERYAHHLALRARRHRLVRASYVQMRDREYATLAPPDLAWFSEEQLARPGFPFSPIDHETAIGWVAAESLVDGMTRWVPARQAFVGYRARLEPLFDVGVTTGTAAHTNPALALRNALLELVQIDCAMGHWFGRRPATRVDLDARTHTLVAAIRRQLHPLGAMPRFYWLPSPDLPGLTIACLLERPDVPRQVVGLGCDLRLNRALYRAFLEAAAVAQLAKVILFRQTAAGRSTADGGSIGGRIYDLDANVAYYAQDDQKALRTAFSDGPCIGASALAPDIEPYDIGDVRYLVNCFRRAGREVVLLDLTTGDLSELGLHVLRVWSPDTLSLSLPSAPPLLHSRFDTYGGVGNDEPHPYP